MKLTQFLRMTRFRGRPPAAAGAQRAEETLSRPPHGGRGQWLTALALGLAAFLVYNSNLRLISSGDNYPARYLPFAIWRDGTLYLDSIAALTAQGEADPYWIVQVGGHAISYYPVTVPVVVSPLYLPAALYLDRYGWTADRVETAARVMEKLAASLIASASVGFMYLLLARRTRCPWPLWLTAAYAFGTNTWMISSQALWQHGLAEMLLVVALYVVLGPCSAARSFGLGLVLALVGAARPPDAIFSAALGLHALHWSRGHRPFLCLGAALPLSLLLAYNLAVTHHLPGAYPIKANMSFLRLDPVRGGLGLLFSPARGLLVFSPFLALVPFALGAALRDPRTRGLAALILVSVVLQGYLYAKLDWRAGCSWGPRWLTDMVPLLVWLLAAGLHGLNRIGRIVLVLTTGVAVAVQVIGAFWYTGASDAVLMREAGDPNRLSVVWEFHNAPFVAELRHGVAPRELALEVEGYVDRIKADGQDADLVIAGTDLTIQGWALTDHHSPHAVRVHLVPTRFDPYRRPGPYPAAETTALGDRPDVAKSRGSRGPTGWEVVLPTSGLEPGAYRVEVKAQCSPGGEFRSAAHRPVTVLPAEPTAGATAIGLEDLARVARTRLRARQSAAGFWQTAYTGATTFDHPQFEMNVFTTALVHDVLVPLARPGELEKCLLQARLHLRDQIEANGLVRYHGRPDAPSLPLLGCVITPDADDTALAWRIGGGPRDARLGAARNALRDYRTAEGLYRTWLAPREKYISVEPGRDPNPTDATIQMNVLMFLAQLDTVEAGSLHKALQSTIAEDRLWVYYERAPIVPLLREGDLAAIGYPVVLPAARRQTTVATQEVWVSTCNLLARCQGASGTRPTRAELRAALELLGRNSFEPVRSNPPLIYHNDLTARPSRYYWSPDLGYALWLRVYQELANDLERTGPVP
ncbi:Uncharacterized protein OS=Methanosaeta thermophila (strain DSM 6194 / PT) GN=Mthe_1075 PE=4 SV=1 [Gemmataceae bacterium]|nr:Uncharacterized protein OS=Methanosaeta thermophila (strain DSM 6194 / PT) GN=Mthe_1075 PE=4 SV=1 [Gemmataceae bacterium]VTU02612.1 Uncharacterized protein OS=Methanosaeta thermophila (strain DSM 6194 / PT) GN=Mthe_1075 PE=4 SV=1 [Gemmataceae bacterium]